MVPGATAISDAAISSLSSSSGSTSSATLRSRFRLEAEPDDPLRSFIRGLIRPVWVFEIGRHRVPDTIEE